MVNELARVSPYKVIAINSRSFMRIQLFVVVLCYGMLMTSCASYRSRYSNEAKEWEQTQLPTEKLLHTMYLIGDAGNDSPATPAPVLSYLKAVLDTASKNSSVLFMGDNIYEKGMAPKEDSVARSDGEYKILSQLKILDDYAGRPLFIPGNHDWNGWGLKGLNRQEKFVEEYLNNRHGEVDEDDWENYFLPDNGCPCTEVIELPGDVVILPIDSQWWLQDWDKERGINSDCEVKNRESFKFQFENLVRKYKSKNLVIAMHHPMYTYGPHSGAYSLKQHIFPLTDLVANLYVPLPGVGTLTSILRKSIGIKQDVASQNYRMLKKALLAGVTKNGSFIFVSGHEHSLQYIENDFQTFIVSGSGSKASPVKLGKGSLFAAGGPGYSTVKFYSGGEAWVQFWQVSPDGDQVALLFQQQIKGKTETVEVLDPNSFEEYEMHKDSIVASVFKTLTPERGPFYSLMLGSHHRDLYQQSYSFPVFDFETFKGGVKPVKAGGGNQTNSLRLEAASGKEYVMRSTTKDASRLVPYPLNKMVAAKALAEENFLSTHPFAPLAIPDLAEAMNVYHTNPVLFYVPSQPGLGEFNAVFGGGVSLVEERPAGKKWKDDPTFGYPDKMVSTSDMLEKLLKNNHHKVDEAWALRTRLLDFLVGDWDRHDDQWRWAVFEGADDSKLYRPVPRDRDQAFSKYDGFVTNIARLPIGFLRQLQVYGPEIKSVKWTTWSARLFDRTFLNGLGWEQWEEQVNYIQQHLTDSVIDNAFENWPSIVREGSAPHIIASLKARRDALMDVAREHYAFVSESVDIIGTEEREQFVVDRIDNDHTRVRVYTLSKKDKRGLVVYDRTFENRITKGINLYGNGDDDEFVVNGHVSKGAKVRMIGGLGKDAFTDSSSVVVAGAKTVVYDDLKKNKLTIQPHTKDKRSKHYWLNVYDRRSPQNEYDITIPFPALGFNPDDGLLVGVNFKRIDYGYKKDPYASIQDFGGTYALATNAFKLNYTADFLDAFGRWDFYLDSYYKGPTYAFNFAGLGNNSLRSVDDEDYYRVRQSMLQLYPAIKKRFSDNAGYFSIGPLVNISALDKTAGRYIASDEAGLASEVFDTKYFGGGKFTFVFNNLDNYQAPHNGIGFDGGFSTLANLESDQAFSLLNASLKFFRSLDKNEDIIFATVVGTDAIFGEGYEFFQVPSVGFRHGLRGYRRNRFYGQTTFWHNTDIRARLLSTYNQVLPFSMGITGSFDHGRVWLDGEESSRWHYDYGGGVWVAPVDLLTFSLNAFIPGEKQEEKPRIVFSVGFDF